jgi:hypothetical protein
VRVRFAGRRPRPSSRRMLRSHQRIRIFCKTRVQMGQRTTTSTDVVTSSAPSASTTANFGSAARAATDPITVHRAGARAHWKFRSATRPLHQISVEQIGARGVVCVVPLLGIRAVGLDNRIILLDRVPYGPFPRCAALLVFWLSDDAGGGRDARDLTIALKPKSRQPPATLAAFFMPPVWPIPKESTP